MASHDVVTDLPGTFYRRPDPDSEPFKQVGDAVEAGETIGVVEIMKSFHEVTSEVSGTLSEFLVESEAMVDGGQVIAVVEEAA